MRSLVANCACAQRAWHNDVCFRNQKPQTSVGEDEIRPAWMIAAILAHPQIHVMLERREAVGRGRLSRLSPCGKCRVGFLTTPDRLRGRSPRQSPFFRRRYPPTGKNPAKKRRSSRASKRLNRESRGPRATERRRMLDMTPYLAQNQASMRDQNSYQFSIVLL